MEEGIFFSITDPLRFPRPIIFIIIIIIFNILRRVSTGIMMRNKCPPPQWRWTKIPTPQRASAAQCIQLFTSDTLVFFIIIIIISEKALGFFSRTRLTDNFKLSVSSRNYLMKRHEIQTITLRTLVRTNRIICATGI